jgi:hypothetical protein
MFDPAWGQLYFTYLSKNDVTFISSSSFLEVPTCPRKKEGLRV